MMMKLQVAENVIQNTTRCRNDFICLSGDGECLCELKYCYSDKFYFVKPGKKSLCSYKIAYLNSTFCSCPTRKEIYKRYSI